jgi:hypothetical protein
MVHFLLKSLKALFDEILLPVAFVFEIIESILGEDVAALKEEFLPLDDASFGDLQTACDR